MVVWLPSPRDAACNTRAHWPESESMLVPTQSESWNDCIMDTADVGELTRKADQDGLDQREPDIVVHPPGPRAPRRTMVQCSDRFGVKSGHPHPIRKSK